MRLVSQVRVRRASTQLLAAWCLLLLGAMLARPLFPAGFSIGAELPPAAEAGHSAYTLHSFVPEQPTAVEAQAGALVKRIEAPGGSGALVPPPEAATAPVGYYAVPGPTPEVGPSPGAAVSPRLTTGPPRLHA
jgi:hypothetical protein